MTQINRQQCRRHRRLPLVLAAIFSSRHSSDVPADRQRGAARQTFVLNILSLTAAFRCGGVDLQDGHLGALGTTPRALLDMRLPVMLFCMAFGLSMDYGVFRWPGSANSGSNPRCEIHRATTTEVSPSA